LPLNYKKLHHVLKNSIYQIAVTVEKKSGYIITFINKPEIFQ